MKGVQVRRNALTVCFIALMLTATATFLLNIAARSLSPTPYAAASSNYYVLTLGSNPYPSRVAKNVLLFGTYKTVSENPIANARITVKYSTDLKSWFLIGVTYTDSRGLYAINWTPNYTGLFTIQAFSNQTKIRYEHVVADYIVALDGTGDLTSISAALSKLPLSGGTIFVKDGTYSNVGIRISGRSHINIVGNGYNTKLTKNSGVLLWIENATALVIKKLHFHHLTNDHYGSISVRGFNDGLTIESNWFTRELTPLIKAADLIWFNPLGTTKNLVFRNNVLKDATIDALALKNIVGGVIETNTFTDAATDTTRDQGNGITVEASSNLIIRENYIRRTGTQSMGGINLFGGSNNITIVKNTVINVEWGIILSTGTSNILVESNQIFDPFSNGIRIDGSSNIQIRKNRLEQIDFYRTVTAIHIEDSRYVQVVGNNLTNFVFGMMFQRSGSLLILSNALDLKAAYYYSGKHGILLQYVSNARVENNTVIRAFDYGLAIYSSRQTFLQGNTISLSQRSGIKLYQSNNCTILSNVLKDNGKYTSVSYGRDGIDILDSSYTLFKWNKAYDDQAVKTQIYGLAEGGASDYNFVIENDFRFNAVKAALIRGAHTVVKDNQV